MNQYVSQGVFDRRVKLIEEKLKHIDGGVDKALLDKLEKENQYYVDQIVDNINRGIISFDSINQQIADALDAAEGYTDTAISQIPEYSDTEIRTMISNFVSGYNNFAANTLRFNDVFDSDGEFTGKIRPTSIETAALFVGTRSQQLALNGIEFRVLPYNSGTGQLQIIGSKRSTESTTLANTIAGFLFHYGFGTDTQPKVYVVYENTLSLTETDNQKGFYIYAQLKATKTEYKQVTITSADFEQKYKSLYTKNSNIYSRVLLSNYQSNRNFYQINSAYISQTSGEGANNQYISIGTISESSFKEKNLDEIYYLNGNTYISAKPLYDSTATYYEKQEETNVNNDAISESEATTGANGSSSSDYIANIIVSQNQIGLNDKLETDGVLTIKLGYISIATNTSKPSGNSNFYKQRKVDMTYGSTTIDGRLITTGRIEGNGVSVDLDTGDIVGKITFKTNDGDMSADTYIQSKYGDIYTYVLGDENRGIQKLIDGLQDQIDGVVDSYFLEGVPTLLTTKLPISDWGNGGVIDYANHEGDTYTDILPLNFDLSEVKNNLPLWIEQGSLYYGVNHLNKTFEQQEYNSNKYCRLKGICSFDENYIISAPPSGLSMIILFYDNKNTYKARTSWITTNYTFSNSDSLSYKYFSIIFAVYGSEGSSPISPSDFMNSGSCLMSSTGDMKYAFSGHSWRFIYENSTPQWLEISDSEVVKALQMAAAAQDTADGKRRVFITDEGVLPTPPYDKGDLWANATYPANGSTYSDCLLRCKTARASDATANISDWQDSNRALQEIDNVTNDGIISKGSEKSSLKKEWEEIKSTYSNAITAITTFDVSTEVSSEKSALDDAYDDLEDVMDVVLGNNDSNINNDTYIGATYNGSPRYDIVINQTNVTANIFRTYWKTYYEAETALNDAIQKAAQDKISAYVNTINAETTAIKDGTTTIAGGMVKSNLIELNKFKYTEVESGSSFNPNTNYYIKQGNTYLYQRGLTSFLPGVTYYTAYSGGVNSGVSGIDDFPAFWAGGSAVAAGNVRTTRDNAQTQTIAGQVQALKNAIDSLPPVFIDFDGISRFGDMWLYGGQIDWQPNFDSYIKIGGAYLIWDNTNKALRLSDQPLINGTHTNAIGLWADGFVSALGANNSGGGGGGDLNYADLWNELTASSSEHYAGSTIINSTHLPLGYTQNNRNYPVQANNNKLYVNVPWTDHYNWSEITNKPFTSIGSNLNVSGGVLSGNPGTVISVRVAATSPVQSSSSSLQTSTLNTTISLADGYGDTKNPYNSKTKNTFLAAPKSSNGVPSFREIEIEDLSNLQIGGRNLFPNTETRHFNLHASSTATFSDNVEVLEWQINEGIRAVGTRGTHARIFGLYQSLSSFLISKWSAKKYVISIYIKNLGQTRVGIEQNGNSANCCVWEVGEEGRKFLLVDGSAYTTYNMGFNFIDPDNVSGYAFDFVYWHPKIEEGNIPTDWTPASEDLLHISGGIMEGDIEVKANNAYDLGKSDKKWNNVYTNKIQIGDGVIEWANGGLHVYHKTNGNTAGLYADWISALGANSGGGSGGSGINWADFWNELNYTETHEYSGTKIIDRRYLPINGLAANSGGQTFYAPTSAGSSGQYLRWPSSGNTPYWDTLDASDIPNLSASKIDSGTFDAARIPTLSITDKTSGTLPINRGGTGNTTGTATYTTTTADTSNTLYPIGVTSSATTTLKRDTGITFINGVINAAKLRINTKHSSSNTNGGIFYYNGTTDYLLIGQGSSNLWIGANETAGTHHIGSTYISSGDGETYISRLVNNTRTNYKVLDAGNTYVSSNKGYINGAEITTITGNAATATTLQTTRTINGTNFNGSADITTSTWGTARNISISDADGTNTGDIVSVNGSENKTLKLPSTIKASFNGTVNGYSISSTINSGTANRLAYYTSNGIDDASTTYVSNTKLAINSTSEPSYNFYVDGTSCFTGDLYLNNTKRFYLGNNTTPSVYKDAMRLDSSNAFIIGNGTSASSYNTYLDGYKIYLRTNTGHSTRLYINEDGNVGIGNTSPDTKLHVSGNIYATGGVTALQAVTSDKRFKKNIKKFEAKEIIDKLQPVEFEWNSKAKKYSDTFKDGKNYGLIAQDSDGIIDGLVFDLPDGKGYKGVRYEKLIPILLQAVKEQQKEIDELKSIVKQLKNK
jgi:hypothetical protein